ncbi:MAG: response regulator transcription factor [Pseudomonadota bacterium]
MGNAQQDILYDDAPHILIVDDDKRIRDLLGKFLMDNGMRITTAEDAEHARAAMRGLTFDLLILDVMMPGETGLELAKSLRKISQIPILMLTARSEAEHRVEGLEIGVDDYVPKPPEPRELLLRINNILRRHDDGTHPISEISMGEFSFHIGRGELKRNDDIIKLTEREKDLLRQFAKRQGQPISREELVMLGGTGSERAVDVQINRLRRKIEIDPSNPLYLQTVRGKGYKLHID